MISYTFTYENLLHLLLVFARITAFVAVAPLIGGQNTGVTNTVKVGFAVMLSILLFGTVPREELVYSSVAGYAVIVIKEVVCGLIIGFAAQICLQITAIAGQVVDMMAGLSMVTMMDPTSGSQVTITGTIYSQVFMTMMVVSGMYRYMFMALADSYQWIPVNGVILRDDSFVVTITAFLRNFFVIGFRVALPVFIVTFVLNIVLGVLAKVAPQMNMFAVGIQIKVLTGLGILFLTAGMLGSASDFIMRNMRTLMEQFIRAMSSI